MLVLQAITGPDAGDPSSVPSRLDFDATAPVAGLKVGYIAQWMKESPATDVDRAAMETMKKLGMELKEVTLPDWPYSSLMPILFAEGAASFEELALNNQLGSLKVQVKDAWPNLFRQARFLSAVDFVQADRLRRKVALEMARVFTRRRRAASCRRCATSSSRSRTSPAIRRSRCARGSCRCRKRGATGRPIRRIRCRSSLRRAACRTASRSSAGCSTTVCVGRVGLALERAFGVAGEKPAGF